MKLLLTVDAVLAANNMNKCLSNSVPDKRKVIISLRSGEKCFRIWMKVAF